MKISSQPSLVVKIDSGKNLATVEPAGNVVGWHGVVPLASFQRSPQLGELWNVIFDEDGKVIFPAFAMCFALGRTRGMPNFYDL